MSTQLTATTGASAVPQHMQSGGENDSARVRSVFILVRGQSQRSQEKQEGECEEENEASHRE